ncbi:hypothetical protein [Neobacillus cucumis]|uniref:hypothetical protein n=1 Tax=Neobacillus cucumis TaxID=1740721 RepID=UPI0028532471|nr:hypothetical protein [Neobacillus cucumis]MDR4948103.1 hypothetical protein [Neobacillus cucumis]
MARLYIPLSQNTSSMTFAEKDRRKVLEQKRKEQALKLAERAAREDVKQFILDTCLWINFEPDQLELIAFYCDEAKVMDDIKAEVNYRPQLLDEKEYRAYVRGQEAKVKMTMKLLGISEAIIKVAKEYKKAEKQGNKIEVDPLLKALGRVR